MDKVGVKPAKPVGVTIRNPSAATVKVKIKVKGNGPESSAHGKS